MGFLNFLSKRRADAPVPDSPFPGWQMYPTQQPPCSVQALPAEAEGYLRPDHPRLKELQERYARCKSDVMVPLLKRGTSNLATSGVSVATMPMSGK